MISAFLYGAVLAMGLIIPLGMQNIFIFNQGASQAHFIKALPSVITAFLCDVILILSAVFGISLIILTQPMLKNAVLTLGILFLAYMGLVTWNSQNGVKPETEPLSITGQIYFSISVSLLNPHAILDTVAIIGTNSSNFSGYDKLAYTIACMGVSFFWFLGLSIAGHYIKKFDITGFAVLLVNKISAIIMWMIAIYLSWQLIGSIHI